MHIITRKRLNEFAEKHPDAKSSLQHWYKQMKSGRFRSFVVGDCPTIVELRAIFPAADQVGNLTVFNIGGGKARLIAAIHYNRQKVYANAR
jgi:mRNA interferase HigB